MRTFQNGQQITADASKYYFGILDIIGMSIKQKRAPRRREYKAIAELTARLAASAGCQDGLEYRVQLAEGALKAFNKR